MKKSYGKTEHYVGDSGKEYYEWQNSGDFGIGLIESRKFNEYISKEDIVMDFGCGGGHTLASLKCKEKYGVEINPFARKEAKKYGFPVYKDLSYVENGSIDKVISNHCLEHVPYPIEALRQIKECLTHNGKIILCIPIDNWKNQKKFNKDDINHHLYTWTPQLIGNCLVEAGFQIDDIRIYTHAWPPKVFTLNRILPLLFFDFLCHIYSIIFGNRQIIAIATKK